MRELDETTALAGEGGPSVRAGDGPSRKSAALRWATYLVRLPLFAVATASFGCVSLLCSMWDWSGRQQHAVAQVWARCLLVIAKSPVQLVGEERLAGAGAAVFASNHLSYMDTPVLFAKLPFQFRILAKQSLWSLPFIGWHLHRSGQVPVDQSSSRASISSLARGVAALKGGMPLLVFPEGGRSASGALQPFLAGAAFMAIRAQAPVVPLTIVGTYEVLPIHVYHLAPRPLFLVVGEPISTVGLTTRDAERLTAEVRRQIETAYLKYSSE